MTRVAINGFGRIGRQFFRIASGDPEIEIVAINDLMDKPTMEYLLKYDTVYREFKKPYQLPTLFAEKDPLKLPWHDLKVDVVIESTGLFTKREDAHKHLAAGATKVLITAPTKDPDLTLVLGVNHNKYLKDKHHIISNASCTTNCACPVLKVLQDSFGIEKAFLTTAHAYTATQKLVDGPDPKDLRRGRAAAENIVPSTTGAANAVIEVMPELLDKIDGLAFRIPVVDVSVVDLSVLLSKNVTAAEVKDAMKRASEGELKTILGVSDLPLVSSDFIGDSRSAIVDLPLTKVVGGNLIKAAAWYDNEGGYSSRLVDVCKILL